MTSNELAAIRIVLKDLVAHVPVAVKVQNLVVAPQSVAESVAAHFFVVALEQFQGFHLHPAFALQAVSPVLMALHVASETLLTQVEATAVLY